MKTKSMIVKAGLATMAVLAMATMVQAAPLYGHADAFNDGNGTGPAGSWSGSISFFDPSGLAGTLEYAVFTAADFNANYSGLGYTTTSSMVYTYQLFVAGTATVSAQLVGLANPAQDEGSFNIGNVAPTSSSLTVPGVVTWNFTSPGIDPGQTSYGLAYSSPKLPEFGSGLTINHGASALMLNVLPVPSANDVPEPTTVALLGLGAALMIRRRRR